MFVKATVLASLAATVLAQTTCTINTPSAVIECQPSLISWNAAEAPYIVSIIPGGQASAAAIRELGYKINETQVTWVADLPAGTSITFKLLDNKGVSCFSAPVTIQAGSSTDCFNTASSSAAAPSDAEESGAASSAPASEEPSASAPAESSAAESSAAAEPSSAAPSVSAAPTTAAPTTQAPATTASSKAAASAATTSAVASPSPTSGAQKIGAAFGAVAVAVAAALF